MAARRIMTRLADAARVLWRGLPSSLPPATDAPVLRSRDLRRSDIRGAVKEVLDEIDSTNKGSGKSKFRETVEVIVSSFTTMTCVSLLMGYNDKSSALSVEQSKNAALASENQRLRDALASHNRTTTHSPVPTKSWLSWFTGTAEKAADGAQR